MERRLTAILAADVVGYSRLMEVDEARTLALLKSLRTELIDPAIAVNSGRVVKLMGDGALVEFASVVDAVACAVAVQKGLVERNATIPEDQRIEFRIGVHLGDVMVEGDDLYGDGVNVAARLEGLSETGGVCISQQVLDQVETKLDLSYEDLGEQQVKNITRPVRAYRVLVGEKLASTPRMSRRSGPGMAFMAGSALVVLLIVGVVVAISWQPWAPREEPASVEAMAFSLPDKPSIAVLPFNNMSEDRNQEYFADGMTEDLITDLSKISGLFVIARNSSFSYKGQQVKVRQVAEELGVQFVLEGSVRRAGDEVRINAQLIDATTGGHLWADRYDGSVADIFDLQDEVTKQIVDALAIKLTAQEAERVGEFGTEVAEAHDSYLLGLSFYHLRTPEGFAQAKINFKRAMDLDPNYSEPIVTLAKMYAQARTIAFTRALKINEWEWGSKARSLLALVEGRTNAEYHVVRSWLAMHLFQHERAIEEAEAALRLSPNDLDAMEALARALIFAGRPRDGLVVAKRAMRQNPTLLARPLMLTGLAAFALGNPGEAIDRIERSFAVGSEQIVYAGIQAAAYGLLGELERAQSAFEVFEGTETVGGSDLAEAVFHFPFSDAVTLSRLAQGFEMAGAKVWYEREDGGYLPLTDANRVRGEDIGVLFASGAIEGKRFQFANRWRRLGTANGDVSYTGQQIHPSVESGSIGTSRVEEDLLCESWPNQAESLAICTAIFSLPKGNARRRWGDYVIITDIGPHPFWIAQP